MARSFVSAHVSIVRTRGRVPAVPQDGNFGRSKGTCEESIERGEDMCVAARELVCDMSLCAVVSHDLESDREPRSLLPFLYQCMREYTV